MAVVFCAKPWTKINPITPGRDTFYHLDSIPNDKAKGNKVKYLLAQDIPAT
jgi:hypothetical protein